MVLGFVAVTALLAWPPVRDLDLAVRDLADAHRPPSADTIAQLFNRLGSGGILSGVALVLAVLLAAWRRSAWPLAPVVAAFVLTGVVIQPLKLYLHRAAPHSPLPDDVEVRLFSQPEGLSYPSGHAVNTIVWYGVLCLLLTTWARAASDLPQPRVDLGVVRVIGDQTTRTTPRSTEREVAARGVAGMAVAWGVAAQAVAEWFTPGSVGRRWLRIVPVVVVGFTTTYLGYHWLTDMFAGLFLGVLIDRLLARTPWPLPRRPLPRRPLPRRPPSASI